jgi:Thiol:disulfide interchange protein DsbD, N-terminal
MPNFPVLAASLLVVASSFQGLAPKPSAIQHVTLAATTEPEAAAPRGKVTLLLDVTPDPKVHVYAPGAEDYVQTTLKVTAVANSTVGKPAYPPSELVFDTALNKKIPQYLKTFRIKQPVSLGAVKSGDRLDLAGTLTYQACDDRMCYPPTTAAVNWTVTVK